MNRRIIRMARIAAACLVAALLLTSCDASLPVADGGNQELIVQLVLPEELEVTTKADENEMFKDLPILDVWVLQYAKETNALIKAGKYSGSSIGIESGGTKKVTTSGFVGVDSYFYVIANGGDEFLAQSDTLLNGGSPITVAALKGKTKVLDSYTSKPTFATADSIVITQDSINNNGGKAVIVAPLERAFARVNVKWNKTSTFKGSLAIKELKVCNIPKAMATYARGGGELADKYPVWTSNVTEVITDTTKMTTGELSQGSGQTFYMPENLRGMGTGTSFQEKNMPKKGPGGSLEGCTFVLMNGEYKYPLPGGSYSQPIKVQYKIYLGGNLTNDYNIQRGYSYDLTVNISGANSADVRVTITDGRVAVFDDVVVMDTVTVEF
ncbi:MAG: DUF4906 domain-containing protein [Parabacteroides sp.]|nr:DUF4906 domain-containing protein [Parabacteroides sp.]